MDDAAVWRVGLFGESGAVALSIKTRRQQQLSRTCWLNVHFHILYLDGVYVLDKARRYDSPLAFHDVPPPSHAETAAIASRIADRVEAILRENGRSLRSG